VIDRRRFLKALGLGSVAAALGMLARAEPKHPASALATTNRASRRDADSATSDTVGLVNTATLYRGDGGRVLASVDDGGTWTRHSNFGRAYRVKRVRTSPSGQVGLDVVYASRSFRLRLGPDGRAWLTS
jgi:anaerobic selenocysteine-containing dehydrogenase